MSSTSDQPSTDPTAKCGVVIHGTVRSGSGRAAKAFTPERIAEIEALFGWKPYPGTLNLTTLPETVVRLLGTPDALTEHETPIGPLRWWRARLGTQPVLVVRGVKSRAPYLEIVAPVRLRDGVQDGQRLSLTRGWP